MLWGTTKDLPKTNSSPLELELGACAGGRACCVGCWGMAPVVTTKRFDLGFCFKLGSEEIENVLLDAVLGAAKGFSIASVVGLEDQPGFTADNLCLCAVSTKTRSLNSNVGNKEPQETPKDQIYT